MATKEQHIDIAKRHKQFITLTSLTVEQYPDVYKPEIFCVWVVLASYYRVVHLFEAIFDQPGLIQPHATLDNEGEADKRRNGLLKKLYSSQRRNEYDELLKEYRGIRRIALHAKYFPGGSVSDYDVLKELDKTREKIVDGHLKRIEKHVAAVLGITVADLEYIPVS